MLRFLLPSTCCIWIALIANIALAFQARGTAQFLFQDAPFAQCHASTIVEGTDGLVAAWFGGEHEKHPSVGIWLARLSDSKWSAPIEVANGDQIDGPVERFPCWNPVLFQPKNGPLLLFYKVGPDPQQWWGMLKTSQDGGKTWSIAARLPEGIAGPIKNKPLELESAMILCGASTEDQGWRVHFEATPDNGKHWWRTPPVNRSKDFSIIQPAFIHNGKNIQALCRSQKKGIVTIHSDDGGMTWSNPKQTNLPNPNSGFDATTLSDGRHLLVYNHAKSGRSPLNLAISLDGENWQQVEVLENEPGEFSYPAIIQSKDGNVHITYTWNRKRIKYVVFDSTQLPQQ